MEIGRLNNEEMGLWGWREWEDSSPLDACASTAMFELDLELDSVFLSNGTEDLVDPTTSTTATTTFSNNKAFASCATSSAIISHEEMLQFDSPLHDFSQAFDSCDCGEVSSSASSSSSSSSSPTSSSCGSSSSSYDLDSPVSVSDVPTTPPPLPAGFVTSSSSHSMLMLEHNTQHAPLKAYHASASSVTPRRKRKNSSLEYPSVDTTSHPPKKPNMIAKAASKKRKSPGGRSSIKKEVVDSEAEKKYRKRYDILHGILEAWNTGGIEDMEELAPSVYDDDVTLISPEYKEGLKGVKPIMEHWENLLDAFPDGIMEEYEIRREDPQGDKIQVSWIFGGTQISLFSGIVPRHEKVRIRGKSFFTFKGDKISQMVLTFNYRDALLALMGMGGSSS